MRCAAIFAVVLIYPAGEAGIFALLLIEVNIKGGAALRASDQSREHLNFAFAVFPPAAFHQLLHRIPQLSLYNGTVHILNNDPFFLRGVDSFLLSKLIKNVQLLKLHVFSLELAR